MLLGQDRGGDQHRYLLAVVDGFEGRPDGDLGLPVTDIATNQTIHGVRGLHVSFYRLNGLQLIRGLFIYKGSL